VIDHARRACGTAGDELDAGAAHLEGGELPAPILSRSAKRNPNAWEKDDRSLGTGDTHAGVVQANAGHSAGVVPEIGRAGQPELPRN
jgi:hypothetical protein